MLELEQITKQYGGRTALNGITLSFGQGIHGIAGPPGAGKSTLLEILAGVLRPTSGRITYRNQTPEEQPGEYARILGYLPQDFGCCEHLTGRQVLAHSFMIRGMRAGLAWEGRTRELADALDLSEVMDQEIRRYSGEMRRRLGILQALLGNPYILILDEPLYGLTQKYRQWFGAWIREWGREHIVVIAARLLSEAEAMADHVIWLQGGTVIRVWRTGAERIQSRDSRIPSEWTDPAD